jgi:CRP/FNR family transcriptional regulator, cyclic AMP receptor protein
MANAAAFSVLKANPVFRGLPDKLLLEIATMCQNRHYRRGEVVFAEGTFGTRLYGVIAGRLMISTASSEGKALHLNVAWPGEVVGEIAFLDGGKRTATGKAASPLACFEIDRTAFFQLLDRRPQLTIHLLQLVCTRVRDMTRSAADSAFLTVPQRLATRMRDLAQPQSEPGTAEVKISQSELAEFLGISRQVVNGYLRAWQRAGRVKLARGKIFINDASL